MVAQTRGGALPFVDAESDRDDEARDEGTESRRGCPGRVSALSKTDEEEAQACAEEEVSDPVESLELFGNGQVTERCWTRRGVVADQGGEEEGGPERGSTGREGQSSAVIRYLVHIHNILQSAQSDGKLEFGQVGGCQGLTPDSLQPSVGLLLSRAPVIKTPAPPPRDADRLTAHCTPPRHLRAVGWNDETCQQRRWDIMSKRTRRQEKTSQSSRLTHDLGRNRISCSDGSHADGCKALTG